MAALLNSLMAVNTNNRHLVWRLRTKLDSASTVNKDSKHYKRASNIQKYKCIQPGIEATAAVADAVAATTAAVADAAAPAVAAAAATAAAPAVAVAAATAAAVGVIRGR